jgi:hypothetical protein
MRKERGNLVICLGYVHHHYWFKNAHCRFEYSAHSATQCVQPITMPSLIQHTLTSWFQWLPNPNLYPCCHQWKHIVLLLIYWCVVLKRAKSETTRCHCRFSCVFEWRRFFSMSTVSRGETRETRAVHFEVNAPTVPRTRAIFLIF